MLILIQNIECIISVKEIAEWRFLSCGSGCKDCEFSLGNDTLKVQSLWTIYWNETTAVRDVQSQDEVLQNISAVINATLDSLGYSNDQLGFLSDTLRDLRLKESIYNSSVMGVLTQVRVMVTEGQGHGRVDQGHDTVDLGHGMGDQGLGSKEGITQP